MAKEQQPADRTLDEIVKTGRDDLVLGSLETYFLDGNISRRRVPVRVSWLLAHGTGASKISETPKTLGELRKSFKGNLSYDDPTKGDHDRSRIVVRYEDPETGKAREERMALAMIY